jgi:hypothetical protein
MSLSQDEVLRIAKAWIEYARLPNGPRHNDSNFWAWERLVELVLHNPEDGWSVIDTIRHLDGSDPVLAILAAGPLEDLLACHGDKFIGRVEALARRDRQFRKGAVWKNDMSDELWACVRAVAGPSW